VLYVNWGVSPISDIQNVKGDSVRMFHLNPDPATREAAIQITVQGNLHDSQSGSLKIDTGDVSIISISAEITSLLMGNIPCQSEAVGDAPIIRAASSAITLFATESSSNPKTAFCLWIGDPPPHGG
jgi:hypothetical protein